MLNLEDGGDDQTRARTAVLSLEEGGDDQTRARIAILNLKDDGDDQTRGRLAMLSLKEDGDDQTRGRMTMLNLKEDGDDQTRGKGEGVTEGYWCLQKYITPRLRSRQSAQVPASTCEWGRLNTCTDPHVETRQHFTLPQPKEAKTTMADPRTTWGAGGHAPPPPPPLPPADPKQQ
jgi:hypothetical protein